VSTRTIIIQQELNSFTIIEGDRICQELCRDEAIGHIAARLVEGWQGHRSQTIAEIREESRMWEQKRIEASLRPCDRFLEVSK
jgi:hypothetical protein